MKSALFASLSVNIIFILGLALYFFSPIFDAFVIHKSLPRGCEYAIKNDMLTTPKEKLTCRNVLNDNNFSNIKNR